MYKKKHKILKIIRRSCLTGRAVWLSHERSYNAEWKAYHKACEKEMELMRGWPERCRIRKQNILHLLGKLTANLPLLGDIPKEKLEAAKALARMAEEEPVFKSDFYDHIQEENRLKRNAARREKRWQEKYGNKNKQNHDYDKQNGNEQTS